MDLAPGVVLAGRFVLDRPLGEGGMGVVWAATHAVTRKVVALKMLKPERAADPVVRQRFVREARTASAVQHPNIIEIRDVIELEDGAPAIVMDLLSGESLGARLEREGRLALDVLAPIMLEVVSAVGTAHAGGIVHRDLKPDNIFLVDAPRGVSVRVLDFGIAKVMTSAGAIDLTNGLTNTGTMLGTPFYMAPEQIYGERDIDHRADVWAVGVMLYECLAGRRPTEAENIGQILRIITEDDIVPIGRAVSGLPDDVARLVERMLRRRRADRPQSLAEAFEVLAAHAGGLTARSFGPPVVVAPRDSLTSADDSAERVRVRVSDDGAGHAATQVSSSNPGVRAISSGDGVVSPTAATLASTTASLSADSARALPRKRRRRGALVAALAIGAVAGATLLVASNRARSLDTSVNASAAFAPPIPSSAASASAPLVASSSPPAAEPPPSAPAPSTRPRPVTSATPRASAPSSPTAKPPATEAPTKPTASPYDHM